MRDQRTEDSLLKRLSVQQEVERNSSCKPEDDDGWNESLGGVRLQPQLYRGARVEMMSGALTIELQLGVVNEKEDQQANDDDAESSKFATPHPKTQNQPRRVFKTRYKNYTACFYISACEHGQVPRRAGEVIS
jgi:hypothetical protein